MLNINSFNYLWGLLLTLSILITPSNAYTKYCDRKYNNAVCDEGYCCSLGKCVQKVLYESKSNILFALDNSYSMVNGDRLTKLNSGFSRIADLMPDSVQMAYTVFSSSATDIRTFTKENVPKIDVDRESHGTGFSDVFSKARDYFESQTNGKNNVFILFTDGIPEHTQSEENDFQAMANTVNAASYLKDNLGVKVYVYNVHDYCDVNESVVNKGVKIDTPSSQNKQSNNSIMRLSSSNYENVKAEYVDGSRSNVNTGVSIFDYEQISGGEKYYICPGANGNNWSDLFTSMINDELIMIQLE